MTPVPDAMAIGTKPSDLSPSSAPDARRVSGAFCGMARRRQVVVAQARMYEIITRPI